MKKRVLALLVAVLTLVSSYTVFTVATVASSPTPEIAITTANVDFADTIYLKFAVKTNVDNVKMLVWTAPEAEYVIGTQDAEIVDSYVDAVSGNDVYSYTKLAAKQMADVIYVRAYAKVEGVDCYSNTVKYSILQYAYNKLGKTATASDDAEFKNLLTKMLDYGAAAQIYLDNYKADRLANANWYQVKLTAGVLDDGFSHGLYLPGDKVTLTAPATDENGTAFGYWADSTGASVADTASFTLTVGSKNETYTPIYGESAEQYSEGLEFESNGDGTCILLGMGDFDGTELVIPPVYEGDNVTEIDRRAFQNEAITLVKIPATITDIGNYAFNGCSALTDVYYDGTEDEWNNNVSIGSNNAPLTNATKHFKTPAQPEGPENNYTEPTIEVRNATASAGDEVEVAVYVYNNPGVSGATLTVSYDSKLSLVAAERGEAFANLDITNPGTFKSPCNFAWDTLDATADDNGSILILTFKIADDAVIGEDLAISCSYVDGDIYNSSWADVDFDIQNGAITVD